MKTILIVGCGVLLALLCCAIVAGRDMNDDDEKAYSGLLEDD